MSVETRISRRQLLRKGAALGAGLALAGPILAACGPTPTPQIIKETVVVKAEVTKVVEKEVTKIVAGTPVKEVVKETIVVEKPVTKVVEKEKIVTATPAPKKIAEIRYISWISRHTEKDVQPYYQTVFGQTHPNIKLKFEVVPYDEYARIVPTNIVAGTLSDTIHINANQHMRYFDSGDFMDITDRVKAVGLDLEKEFWLTGAEVWCGRAFAIPSWGDLYLIYYNKTLLKKEWGKDIWDDLKNQWTFNNFVEASLACTKDTNKDGRIDQFGGDLGHTSHSLNNAWCWTMGGDMVNWPNMKSQVNTPISMQFHKMLEDWVMKKKIVVPPEAYAEASQLGLPAIFAGGKVAFWFRSITSISILKESVKGPNYFDWDICSMPWYDASHPGIQLVSGHPYSIYTKTKYPDECFEWIYKLGTEGMMWMAQGPKTFPPHWYPAFAVWMDQTAPPAHMKWIPDGFKQGYGIHFRHYTKENVDRIYADALNKVFLQNANMEEVVKGLDAQINAAVEYGKCNPYAGVKMPMHGLGLQEILKKG